MRINEKRRENDEEEVFGTKEEPENKRHQKKTVKTMGDCNFFAQCKIVIMQAYQYARRKIVPERG